MRERAVVVALEGEQMWVEAVAKSCPRCLEGKGCGGGIFLSLSSGTQRRLCLPNTVSARVQQSVWLVIDDAGALKVSAVFYGLPLLALLAAGAFGALLAWPEPLVVVCALLAMSGSFMLAQRCQPWLFQRLGLHAELIDPAEAGCQLAS